MRTRWIALGAMIAVVAATAVAAHLGGVDWGQSMAALRDRLVASAGPAKPPAAAPSGTPAGTAPAQPAVTVSQPVSREIVEWDTYTGRFEAVESVDVRARVSGYLTKVHFEDGQVVREGDLLFVIDPRPFERAVGLAAAELEQAKVRVNNALLDVERGRPLLERNVISEKVFDDRENVVRDAQAAVKVNEERLKEAELNLSFTRITAPIAGRIGRTNVTAGNYVSGGTDNATSLLSIVSQDPIYIYFDINENNAIKYKRMAEAKGQSLAAGLLGAHVEIALADETGFPHRASVDFVDNRLDEGTGTLLARARVDNANGLFSPGMFARVRLEGSPKATALLLPDTAIGADQTSRFVWAVDDAGMPKRQTVKLGPLSDGLRIVREGVTASDWVVVNGIQRVRRNQAVTANRQPIAVSEGPPPAAGGQEPSRTR